MKLTIIALLLVSFSASAQFSIIGGLNYSSLYGRAEPDKKPKFGPRVGVLVQEKHFQLQTLYSTKGMMENRNADPISREFHHDRWQFNMNYLQQTAAYSIGKGWFTGQLGAYGAYLLNSRLRNTYWPNQDPYPANLFRRFDYGPLAGVSVDMAGASLHFSYERGLRPINPPGYVHEYFQNESATFSVSVPL